MNAPNEREIEALYREHGQAFAAFCALLKEYNAKFNLTAITDDEGIRYKHFYDSLYGNVWFGQNAAVAEIGSGGGFPSIPLKIARPDLRFTLVESTKKKCEFLKTVVRELGLREVEIVNARAEELARDSAYREQFDVCCARAVARLNTLAEYCMPFVKMGGTFVAYKGDDGQEMNEARRAVSLLGGGELRFCAYELPLSMGKRRIVYAVKEKKTPALYPRGNGRERSKPLV